MKKAFGLIAASVVAVSGVSIAAAPSSKPVAAPVARVASEGVVQVNRGEGFVTVGSAAMVSSGDQLRLVSSGELVYGDGCSVQVAALDAFTVAAASPCARAPMLARAAFQVAGAGAGAGTTGAGAGSAAAGAGAAAGIGVGAAAAGVAAAAAVAVAVASSSSDDDKPVSA